MRKNNGIILIVLVLIYATSCGSKYKSKTGQSGYEHKVDSLMAIMTIDEKLGQLNLPVAGDITTGLEKSTGVIAKIKAGKVGGLFNVQGVENIRAIQKIAVEESRLGIPIIFAMDVIHGYKTLFPIPLGLSCSWNIELIERSARIAANEATADGISWTFSPMVDISRDPRWGRVAEGSGEDPYLGAEIAKAMVRGYQGKDLTQNNTMMACPKHFALNGAPEAGRDYNTIDMSHQKMYNEYFPPFKAAVEQGAGSLMSANTEFDGLQSTGNRWLLTELLRNDWGFEGFVVSDYTGLISMINKGLGDSTEVARIALKAGNDMDMVSEVYLKKLKASIDNGSLSMDDLNRVCRRILLAKYKLGLFDDPYKYCDVERAAAEVFTPDNRAEARRIAAQSFVLLKNRGNILPLEKSGTIALIGPMADNARNMAGTWSVAGDFENCVSVKKGLENLVGNDVNILYAKGSNIYTDADMEARVSVFGKPTNRDDRPEEELINEALSIALKADVIVAAMGEAAESSGECSSLTNIEFPDNQRRLLKALLKTGKPLVLVLFNGRPLAIKWEQENVPAILDVWFGGTEAGNAIAEVLFGDQNPSGKLTMTFPQNTGQIPIYYSFKNAANPDDFEWFTKFRSNYLDVSNYPVYPFGYGLSYSTFEYGELKVSNATPYGNETIEVSVEVTNTSEMDGKEVIQLYIRDLVGSVTRPFSELRAFKKVEIKAGETQTVRFPITTEDLKFYNYDLEHVWEPGKFEFKVGGNSMDVKTIEVEWRNN